MTGPTNYIPIISLHIKSPDLAREAYLISFHCRAKKKRYTKNECKYITFLFLFSGCQKRRSYELKDISGILFEQKKEKVASEHE
jgi:hypothetical protein